MERDPRPLVGLMVFAAALAQLPGAVAEAPEGPYPPFAEADADGDGYLTLKEARAVGIPTLRFLEEDLDHDGRIDIVQYWFGIQEDVTESQYAPEETPEWLEGEG